MIKKYFILFILAVHSIMANVIELRDQQLESFIQSADKPIIIDFWSDYCPPCVKMKPIFEEVAEECRDQYFFVSINISEGQLSAQKYSVRSIPTFKILDKSEVIGTLSGYIDKKSFSEQIENIIHQKITQSSFLAAIQADDVALVSKCLNMNEIDVNGITHMDMMGIQIPMTPLMAAVSRVIFSDASPEIVNLLLEYGADQRFEIEYPKLNESMEVVGSEIQTARLMVELMARVRSEDELAKIEEVRQAVISMQERAAKLLELLNHK